VPLCMEAYFFSTEELTLSVRIIREWRVARLWCADNADVPRVVSAGGSFRFQRPRRCRGDERLPVGSSAGARDRADQSRTAASSLEVFVNENRIPKVHVSVRLRLWNARRSRLAGPGNRLDRRRLARVALLAQSHTSLGWLQTRSAQLKSLEASLLSRPSAYSGQGEPLDCYEWCARTPPRVATGSSVRCGILGHDISDSDGPKHGGRARDRVRSGAIRPTQNPLSRRDMPHEYTGPTRSSLQIEEFVCIAPHFLSCPCSPA
jgi:hypothetical protein